MPNPFGTVTVTGPLMVGTSICAHLRIPDLPDQAARDRLEAEDILIKSIDRHTAPHALETALLNSGEAADNNESFQPDPVDGFRKASPDDPKHPGWPAGTEGGRGGQFRPKDASELTQKVKSLIARRALRMGLLAGLRVGLESLANLLPGVDVAADVLLVADIARTVAEFRKPPSMPLRPSSSSRTARTVWRSSRFHPMAMRNSPAMTISIRVS